MKFVVLITGLLSLLLFSNEGMVARQNYHTFTGVSSSACFDADQSKPVWDFENSETCVTVSSKRQLSHHKKRIGESFCRFFDLAESPSAPAYRVQLNCESRTNLFLIYHFSLSLWQVFLQ